MLTFFLQKRLQKVVAWSLMLFFVPGFSAIGIAGAFAYQKFEKHSCLIGEPEVLQLQPFPNLEKVR